MYNVAGSGSDRVYPTWLCCEWQSAIRANHLKRTTRGKPYEIFKQIRLSNELGRGVSRICRAPGVRNVCRITCEGPAMWWYHKQTSLLSQIMGNKRTMTALQGDHTGLSCPSDHAIEKEFITYFWFPPFKTNFLHFLFHVAPFFKVDVEEPDKKWRDQSGCTFFINISKKNFLFCKKWCSEGRGRSLLAPGTRCLNVCTACQLSNTSLLLKVQI